MGPPLLREQIVDGHIREKLVSDGYGLAHSKLGIAVQLLTQSAFGASKKLLNVLLADLVAKHFGFEI